MEKTKHNIIRKIGALVFAGFFMRPYIEQAIYNLAPKGSVLFYPELTTIAVSILAWTVTLLLPLFGAFVMFQNKPAGIIIIRIYTGLLLPFSIFEMLIPGFSASVELTDQEKADSAFRALILTAILSFVMLSTFVGRKDRTVLKS